MISRFLASSSFFSGSSFPVSAAGASSGGGVSSSGLFSVSVDCHRWKRRGDIVLKLDGWGGLLDSSSLVLDNGVENEREKAEDVNVRLCLRSARRIMIRY